MALIEKVKWENLRRRQKRIIIGVILIVSIVGLAITIWSVDLFGSTNEQDLPHFSTIELEDQEIQSGGSTLILTRIKNPTKETYETVIQISTEAEEIRISRLGETSQKQNGEYILNIYPDPLAGREETRKFSTEVGGEIPQGWEEGLVNIDVSLKIEEQVYDSESFSLKITR